MFPAQIHLVLNHIPLTGLVLGLVFYILGIKKLSEAELLIGERIFVAMGAISILIVASGLRSAHALVAAQWLDASAVLSHQRWHPDSHSQHVAGHLERNYPNALAQGPKVGFVRLRRAILLLATVSFGMVLWTSRLGGELRHNELRSGSQTASFSTHR
jgi:hypothetical protein